MIELTLYILLGLFLIYIGICAFYFFFQERLIFVPLGQLRKSAPIELASDYQEIFLEGEENGFLHAIQIKAKNPRGCILYFHGNTGNVSRWGPIAEEFTSFGFDIILPDYRGYGKSRGKRNEKILFKDALLWYQYALKNYPENKICLYGRSLGSAPTSYLAGKTKPGGIILETPFNHLLDVAKFHTRFIPVIFLLRFTFKNDEHLSKASSPILIAHGTKDKLVPYRCGLELFKVVKEKINAEMVTVPGGKHGDLNGFPVFRERLKKFFDSHFPRD